MPRFRITCLTAIPLTTLTLFLVACASPVQAPTAGSAAAEPTPAEQGGDLAISPAADGGSVVIYTSVDQNFSEPVLRAFEAETGIKVQPVFDVEAAKTTGLVNRLVAEKDNPQADVWWNGEFAQTIDLAKQDVLAAYASPNAADIPAEYKDPDGRWSGLGGRARVILVNTDLVDEAATPDSIQDFLDPAVDAAQTGIAYPVFGTTATQAAALYKLWGDEDARAYFQQLADRGVRVLDGNGAVRDLVVDGQLAFGLTDTDDACGAVEKGAPVKIVFPDQGDDGIGTLVIPNTVGLVAGGPNPEAGKKLVDYLLSQEAEAGMVESGWIQVALRPLPAETAAAACVDASDVRGMSVGLIDVAEFIERAKTDMAEIFVQ